MGKPLHKLSLERLKNEARDLFIGIQQGHSEALRRLYTQRPDFKTDGVSDGGPQVVPELRHAQFVVAREHGFPGWAELKAELERQRFEERRRLDRFIEAALVDHRAPEPDAPAFEEALRILAEDPSIRRASFHTALITGERGLIRETLRRDPAAAHRPGGPEEWEPLLYVCFSRFLHRGREERGALQGIVEDLLEAGANPNASYDLNGDPNARQTCLYGAAGIARSAGVTRRLLEAGADPNDGAPGWGPESLYHAAEAKETECLRLILEARPHRDKISYCLARALDFENPEAVRLFLERGADPDFVAPNRDGSTRLHHAVRNNRSPEIIRLLLEHGANPRARDAHGFSPHRLAVRYGATEAVRLMRERGADAAEATPLDAVIGACFRGEKDEAARLAAAIPGLIASLHPADAAMLPEAASRGNRAVVESLLELGFPLNAPGREAMTALHWAAWNGNADLVDFLIAKGASLTALNAYGGTPLGTAVWAAAHGATFGDHVAVAKSLIRAGAAVRGHCRYPTRNPPLDEVLRPYFE